MYIEDCGQCEFDESHDNVHVLIVGLISDLIFSFFAVIMIGVVCIK